MSSLPTETKGNQSSLPLILGIPSSICSFVFLLASLYLWFIEKILSTAYVVQYLLGLKLSPLSASLEMNILLPYFLLTLQPSQSYFCFSYHCETTLSKWPMISILPNLINISIIPFYLIFQNHGFLIFFLSTLLPFQLSLLFSLFTHP